MVDDRTVEQRVKEILARPDFICFLKEAESILGDGFILANEEIKQILRTAKYEAKAKMLKYQGDILEWLKQNMAH